MPVVVAGETFAVVDAGAPAQNILIEGSTNTPLSLDKSDHTVVTLETTTVL